MMWKHASSASVLDRLDNARGGSGGSVIKRACLLAAAIGCLSVAAPAQAQVVLFVNGDPVTNFDIEQRGKLVQLTLHKTVSRDELINDLIDDKIKISVGKRYRIDITDADVDKQFAEMGARVRMGKSQFEQVLAQGGVEPDTMKEHIKAEISWATIVQGKFQARLLVNEKDVLQAMESEPKKRVPTRLGTRRKVRSALSTRCGRSCSWWGVAPALRLLRRARRKRKRCEPNSTVATPVFVMRAPCETSLCASLSSNHRQIWRPQSGTSWIKCRSAT